MAESWKHNHNPVVLNRFDSNGLLCPQRYLKAVSIRNPYLVYLLYKNQGQDVLCNFYMLNVLKMHFINLHDFSRFRNHKNLKLSFVNNKISLLN